jgi:hypothetical protein
MSPDRRRPRFHAADQHSETNRPHGRFQARASDWGIWPFSAGDSCASKAVCPVSDSLDRLNVGAC